MYNISKRLWGELFHCGAAPLFTALRSSRSRFASLCRFLSACASLLGLSYSNGPAGQNRAGLHTKPEPAAHKSSSAARQAAGPAQAPWGPGQWPVWPDIQHKNLYFKENKQNNISHFNSWNLNVWNCRSCLILFYFHLNSTNLFCFCLIFCAFSKI